MSAPEIYSYQVTQPQEQKVTPASLVAMGFHRITARWFCDRYGQPTAAQRAGWPAILRGEDTLIAAPTGSGKTLTAFLVCIDRLLRSSLAGNLQDETKVLYVSPLKALSNDVRKNLEIPLKEILEAAQAEGQSPAPIRAMVRTGDTPTSQRQAMTKRPPHILVTTPESLFLLLTSDKGRTMLRTVETVIIDEIHALARDKRGSHLALSLERLSALCLKRPVRIGLSATQKPLETVAAYLVGTHRLDDRGNARCTLVNTMERRQFDLGIEVPPSALSAVCSQEQWEEIYGRLKELIEAHQSTIVFVNTRKLAERVAFHLSQTLGEDAVQSHHGSLSKDLRLAAEEKLKSGRIKAIVATASLELGIDVGTVDLVCQIGSPRAISTFLQRIGRSGHAVGGTPKGRLFALTRDELLEAMGLLLAVQEGELDHIVLPRLSMDILAQQIIAEAAAREISVEELGRIIRGAYSYRHLTDAQLDQVLEMLSHGFAKGRRKLAYIHRDQTKGTLRAKRAARMAAIMSGGAIPEQGDFRVVTEDDGTFVGTVNEEFAIESSRGDVFLLGNTSWQLVGLRGTEVVVRDAQGAPPTIPFWQGESPGRTIELSQYLARIRGEIASLVTLPESADDPLLRLDALEELKLVDPEAYRRAREHVEKTLGVDSWTSLQAVHYVAVQKAAHGFVPTQREVIFERFFDDSGGMQLVIHAPFGMRINKGFGLALRKRFCRSFDFELQASADNDGIVLSLGPQHSFPIEQMFTMLNPRNVQVLLEQAILQVPLFNIRWRWNTTRSLAVLRNQGGKRVPPVLQRFRADDLMTAVFPQQTQCKEHVTGDIELPDHPLVQQTMDDCLYEAIDLDGLKMILSRMESGDIKLIARDTREPSPFAYQLLNAYPYAFLDDAPLEERRARAVSMRRTLPMDMLKDLGRLDSEAIDRVASDAWPEVRSADDLYDTLASTFVLDQDLTRHYPEWNRYFDSLWSQGRVATLMTTVAGTERTLWASQEHIPLIRAAYGDKAILNGLPFLGFKESETWEAEDARLEIIRAYLEIKGVLSAQEIAHGVALDLCHVEATLPALEARGDIIRGTFRERGVQWCPRRLLARIQRLTIEGLRNQIKPASLAEFYTFLLGYQRLLPGTQGEGRSGLTDVLAQLAGFDAPAGAWEKELLSSRVIGYQPAWLDELTHGGVFSWGRLMPPAIDDQPRGVEGPEECGNSKQEQHESVTRAGMTRVVPIAIMPRDDLSWLLPPERPDGRGALTSQARTTLTALEQGGAQFFTELRQRTRLLDSELETALGELARLGLVTADGFGAIRPFVSKARSKPSPAYHGLPQRFAVKPTYSLGGRWAVFPGMVPAAPDPDRTLKWAWLLLRRYGVMFRELLARESAAPSWGELARVYRRLEAQGEIRGGLFVSGRSGEQYALPDAIAALRKVRDHSGPLPWTVISAADPLNLFGIITGGDRISAEGGIFGGDKIASSRSVMMVVQGADIVATREGHEIQFYKTVPPDVEGAMREALQLSGVFRTQKMSAYHYALQKSPATHSLELG